MRASDEAQASGHGVGCGPRRRTSQPYPRAGGPAAASRGADGPLQPLLVESGVKMTVGTYVLACFAAACAGAAVDWQLLHMLTVALVLGGLAASCLICTCVSSGRKRLRTFEEQFPEAMDLISRALRAGHAFTTGLGMVADEIPAPVGTEFRRLYDEQNFGMSLPDAMRAMARTSAGARRALLRDRRAHPARIRRQSLRGARQPGARDARAIQVQASDPGDLGARAHQRVDPVRSAARCWRWSSSRCRRTSWICSWEDPLGINLILIAGALQVIGTFIISRMVRIEY